MFPAARMVTTVVARGQDHPSGCHAERREQTAPGTSERGAFGRAGEMVNCDILTLHIGLYSMIVCHNQWCFKNISTQDFSPKRCKKSLPKVSPKGFAIEAVPQSADAPSHPSYIKVEELRKFALEAEEGTSVHCFFGKKSRKDSKNNLEVIDGEV